MNENLRLTIHVPRMENWYPEINKLHTQVLTRVYGLGKVRFNVLEDVEGTLTESTLTRLDGKHDDNPPVLRASPAEVVFIPKKHGSEDYYIRYADQHNARIGPCSEPDSSETFTFHTENLAPALNRWGSIIVTRRDDPRLMYEESEYVISLMYELFQSKDAYEEREWRNPQIKALWEEWVLRKEKNPKLTKQKFAYDIEGDGLKNENGELVVSPFDWTFSTLTKHVLKGL